MSEDKPKKKFNDFKEAKEESAEDAKIRVLKEERFKATKAVNEVAGENKEKIELFQQCLATARNERKLRDEQNNGVKKLVNERRSLEQKISEAKKSIGVKQAGLGGFQEFAGDAARLEQEIDDMEWFLQTEALSAEDERKLSKKINELRSRLPKTHAAIGALNELRSARKSMHELVNQSRALREKISVHANASDAHHEQMLKNYAKADELSKEIGSVLEELDAKRAEADRSHGEFVQTIHQIRSQEQAEKNEESHARHKIESRIRAELNAQAQDLVKKMREGKKLSMEELMVLRETNAF